MTINSSLFSYPYLKLQFSMRPRCRKLPSPEFHPLHPQNLHPEGDGGVFAPSSVPALLMTPDCRRSLMRIKWAPFHPSPSSSSSLHPSSPHAMQAFLLLLLPISPIGRSLHHRGCQSGKTPTAGRGSPTQILAHSMFHGVQYIYLACIK